MVLDGVTLEARHCGRIVWYKNRVEVQIADWNEARVWITTRGGKPAPVDPESLTWHWHDEV